MSQSAQIGRAEQTSGLVGTMFQRRIPIRLLVGLVSAVFGLLLCVAVATILIVNAREAVNQEIQSAYGIARASASMRLPQETRGTDDTMAIARQLADELDGLRHVAADITDPWGDPIYAPDHAEPQDEDPPPAWFAALMRPEMSEDRLAITRYPNVLGFLHISTDPNDEIAEAWEDFRIVLPVLIGTALSLIALAVGLTVFVLRRLQLVQDAMAHIQAGDLTRRAPDSQFVELASLAEGVNELASHLQAQRAENDLLQARLINLSEAERAAIASDLHDEMGPLLFAVRAAVQQAEAAATQVTGPGLAQLNEALDAIARHAAEVQRGTRDAINDLRPMLAGDASLSELLEELVASLSEIAPEGRITLSADKGVSTSHLGELSIYRFVRESVLNALRHGQADHIRVSLKLLRGSGAIVTRVADNGIGPGLNASPSMGQIGIRDRARALGGTYLPPWRDEGWTLTELRMPLE